ncbi:hypothetical protein CU633_01535 [Bacillus sp. V3-13]|uniref:hypothetical protein n=1 Tax=Bacillus sp. V3-13 TaxID=2053728 RepID=UPI000C78D5C1|nr:hypothetical protein [Bacillus sp. V3-13]PLR79215.1 hypothetical protein CU633_01535 [Bacillus sp. V3-13]
MRSLQDALYNWLSIKVVSDARPDDTAAKDTTKLFEELLAKDHGISEIVITKGETMYELTYSHQNQEKKSSFPVELIDVMINQIEEEPEKFINYPEN